MPEVQDVTLELAIERMQDNVARYTKVKLYNENINSAKMERIRNAMKLNTHVEELHFDTCRVDNQGAEYLADIIFRCDNLTTISLDNNLITDKGARKLAQAVKEHPNLTSIDGSGNTNQGSGKLVGSEEPGFCAGCCGFLLLLLAVLYFLRPK